MRKTRLPSYADAVRGDRSSRDESPATAADNEKHFPTLTSPADTSRAAALVSQQEDSNGRPRDPPALNDSNQELVERREQQNNADDKNSVACSEHVPQSVKSPPTEPPLPVGDAPSRDKAGKPLSAQKSESAADSGISELNVVRSIKSPPTPPPVPISHGKGDKPLPAQKSESTINSRKSESCIAQPVQNPPTAPALPISDTISHGKGNKSLPAQKSESTVDCAKYVPTKAESVKSPPAAPPLPDNGTLNPGKGDKPLTPQKSESTVDCGTPEPTAVPDRTKGRRYSMNHKEKSAVKKSGRALADQSSATATVESSKEDTANVKDTTFTKPCSQKNKAANSSVSDRPASEVVVDEQPQQKAREVAVSPDSTVESSEDPKPKHELPDGNNNQEQIDVEKKPAAADAKHCREDKQPQLESENATAPSTTGVDNEDGGQSPPMLNIPVDSEEKPHDNVESCVAAKSSASSKASSFGMKFSGNVIDANDQKRNWPFHGHCYDCGERGHRVRDCHKRFTVADDANDSDCLAKVNAQNQASNDDQTDHMEVVVTAPKKQALSQHRGRGASRVISGTSAPQEARNESALATNADPPDQSERNENNADCVVKDIVKAPQNPATVPQRGGGTARAGFGPRIPRGAGRGSASMGPPRTGPSQRGGRAFVPDKERTDAAADDTASAPGEAQAKKSSMRGGRSFVPDKEDFNIGKDLNGNLPMPAGPSASVLSMTFVDSFARTAFTLTGVQVVPVKLWSDLFLNDQLQRNMRDELYLKKPDPLLSHTFPLVRKGEDVYCKMDTYLPSSLILPVVDQLLQDVKKGPVKTIDNWDVLCPRALVMCMWSGECQAAFDLAQKAALNTKLVVCRSDYTCPIAENVDELVKGCHILCTTIARFTHLMDLGIVSLKHVKYLVLLKVDDMLTVDGVFDRYLPMVLEDNQMPPATERNTLLMAGTKADKRIDQLAERILKPEHALIVESKND